MLLLSPPGPRFFSFSRSRRFPLLPLCLAALIALGGCASPQHRFAKIEKQQQAGQYALALTQYAGLLARVPERDSSLLSQIQLRMGECLWSTGHPREAYAALLKSVEENGGNLAAHLRLAELLLAGGAPAEATQQANLVLSHQPDNAEALSVLGASYAATGQTAQAKFAFTKVLTLDPARTTAAVALAEIFLQDNERASAVEVLGRAAVRQPKDPMPWLALGRMEEMAGNNSAAEQDYRKAVAAQDTRETNLRLAQFLARAARIDEAEAALRKADAGADAPLSLADFDFASGRLQPAITAYRDLLQSSANPEKTPVQGKLTPSSRGMLAARLIEANLQRAQQEKLNLTQPSPALDQAARDYDVFHADFDSATAETLQSELSLAKDDLAAAGQHAQNAVTLAPESASAHYALGMVKSRSGNAAGAAESWQKALEHDPNFLPARQSLAQQALEIGDTAGAELLIASVVREEPANVQALCLYARALAARKRFDDAVTLAHRALAADRNSAEAHVVLGEIALRRHRLAGALIEYEQAIVVQPHSPAAMEGLAQVYRQGSVTRDMLRRMEAVAANPPQSAPLMEIAGRLYADHGWYSAAERCLHRAVEMDPAQTSATQALAQTYILIGNARAAADSLSQSNTASAAVVEGVRAGERNDLIASMRNYDAALRQGDRSGLAANNLAWLYAQQGIRLDRALSLALLAHDLAPRNPAVLDTLGFVHLRRREYSQAVEVLKKAIQIAQQEPKGSDHDEAAPPKKMLAEFRRHLAEAYLRSGQTEAAQALEK